MPFTEIDRQFGIVPCCIQSDNVNGEKMSHSAISSLNQKFAITGQLEFIQDAGGLVIARINNPMRDHRSRCRALIS